MCRVAYIPRFSFEKEKAALLFRRQLVLLTNLLKLLYGDVSSLILFYKQGKRLSCLRNKCYLTSLMTVRGNKKAATCVSYRFLYVCKE